MGELNKCEICKHRENKYIGGCICNYYDSYEVDKMKAIELAKEYEISVLDLIKLCEI